jgi:hypothetical protein
MNVPDNLPTPGARLAYLCDLVGLSYRDLDKLAGKPNPGHAAAIVRGGSGGSGRKSPRPDAVAGYAEVLGTDVAYLLLGDGKPPSKRKVAGAVAAARERSGNDRAHEPRVTTSTGSNKRNVRSGLARRSVWRA